MTRVAVLLLTATAVSCGKSGPPLPPLVRVPVAPTNLTADRRGDRVDLAFAVPDVNTDRSKPANIARVDVYAITGPATATDDQLLKRGTKVASIDVKAPKDPNEAADEDEPADDVEPPEGRGLDQGAIAHVSETLTPASREAVEVSNTDRRARAGNRDASVGPLLGPPAEPSRYYAAVGVSTRGKRGPFSTRVSTPLVALPRAPAAPTITYTEKAVTVSWLPIASAAAVADDVLPSRPLGVDASSISYTVYDVSATVPLEITKTPVSDTTAADERIAWGEERCYVVRAAKKIGGATIESEPSPRRCERLVDTFPPAPPKALRSVGGDGVINLIWDANSEPDLAGYVIYRAAGEDPLKPIVPEPIRETTFTDTVQPGVQFTYALKAVDTSGNASDFSERATDAAR